MWPVLDDDQKLVAVVSELWQIYYREHQKEKIFPFARPYFNEGLTIFFENTVIAELVSSTAAEKIAVCSWKLAEKMKERVGLKQPLTQEALESDYDVLSFTKNSERHRMLAFGSQWHPDFMDTITTLWEKVGYKIKREPKNPIYKNSFSARSDIYKRYVEEFLIPAMQLSTTDEQLTEMMNRPSRYGSFSKTADMDSVTTKLAMTDYPIAPFILERCPSIFFDMHNINVTYL